jgi:hypothetical protein
MTAQDGLVVDNDGATVATFDRATSDGTIAEFQKGGTTVGAIGTLNGFLSIGTADTGLLFDSANNQIRPMDVGTNAVNDGVIDLGRASSRFKDLYLSGSVFLGGTGAANALDDYEEGTFTPQVADAITGGNTGSGDFSASYTKIGNVVTCEISLLNINTTGMTGANILYMRGIPFVTSAGVNHTGSCFVDRITFSGFVTPFIFPGETYMDFRESVSNTSDVALTVSDVNVSGGSDIFLSITYLAA